MWDWLTPGIARPFGHSLTLGFRKHSLFEASAVLGLCGVRWVSLSEGRAGYAGCLCLSALRGTRGVSACGPCGVVNRCPWSDTFLGKFFTPDTFALCASVSGAMSKSMS